MGYKIALAVVLVLVCFGGSYGIKCYNCAACNDPFDANGKSTTDCPKDYSCSKSKGEIHGISAVSRGCAITKDTPQGCSKMEIIGVDTNVCYCNTDLCNAAVTSKMSITSIFAVYAGILLFTKIL